MISGWRSRVMCYKPYNYEKVGESFPRKTRILNWTKSSQEKSADGKFGFLKSIETKKRAKSAGPRSVGAAKRSEVMDARGTKEMISGER